MTLVSLWSTVLLTSLYAFPNTTLRFSAVNLYIWETPCTSTLLPLCHRYLKN